MLSFENGGASAGFYIEVEKEHAEKHFDKDLLSKVKGLSLDK